MHSTDVVVVGAGVAGCVSAYFLSQAGAKVVVVERDALASHASGFAYGGLNPLGAIGIPLPVVPLVAESMDLHVRLARQLREETGIDTEFCVKPSLTVAFTDEEAKTCQGELGIGKDLPQLKLRWMDGNEARSIEPRLSPRVVGALYAGGTMEVNAYKYTLALAQSSEKRGVVFRQGELLGLKRNGRKVTGVLLKSGEVACDKVVLALGPWSAMCSTWLGAPAPVEPLKGEILRLKAKGPPFTCSIEREGAYLTTKADGLVWAGTTMEKVGFDEKPTPKARAQIMKSVLEMVPGLSESELVQHTACMRPLSADGLPLLGPIPGWDGAYIATGAGGQGILLSPAFGRVMADMVVEGKTPLPVGAFSPGRFAGQKR